MKIHFTTAYEPAEFQTSLNQKQPQGMPTKQSQPEANVRLAEFSWTRSGHENSPLLFRWEQDAPTITARMA